MLPPTCLPDKAWYAVVPLKVAFDSRDGQAARPGGWGRYALELSRALRTTNGIELLELSGGWPGPEALWEQIGLPLKLRGIRPDVVHAPNCFLPLRRPCPGVVTIHDLAFEAFPDDFSRRTGAKFRSITPRAARSAERVITVSQFTKSDVVARYGVDPAKVRVVHNGPSLPVGDAPLPEGEYILGVGDLRAKKNWARLAAAWHAAGIPHRLVIAGADAGEGEALRASGVETTGYVTDQQLDALMRGADLLVHPSLYEGFGLVVLEAMVRGTPVAAANNTALPEAGGDAAVYFDPLDVDAIAAAITEALGRRAELSAAGREHAKAFSWERAAQATAAVYAEAAGC
jgi:glycosyltransferase involved in cell wall biosynthesis